MEMEKLSIKELEVIIEQGMSKREIVLQADPAVIFQVLRDYNLPPMGFAFGPGEPVPSFDNGKIRGNGRRLEIAMTKTIAREATVTMFTPSPYPIITTTSKAIIFEVERLSDEQTLITGKCLPEAKAYFELLWQNLIQQFTASKRYDPAVDRDEKIHQMWLNGWNDKVIGANPKVFLSADRVKQIRYQHGWKKTSKKQTT